MDDVSQLFSVCYFFVAGCLMVLISQSLNNYIIENQMQVYTVDDECMMLQFHPDS